MQEKRVVAETALMKVRCEVKSGGVSTVGQQTPSGGWVGAQASVWCLWFSMDWELGLRTMAESLDAVVRHVPRR